MNTLHLKYAVEVERTGSITQAADNLFMGQPNLSKAIKELEDTLGIVIFKRISKGVIPTEKGKEFLNYAKKILAQVNEMESLYKHENEDRQSFSISIPRGSYIANAFTRLVSELDISKEIDVNIKETNSMKTISDVFQSKYKLGIIRYQTLYEDYFLKFLADKEIVYDPIWEFEYLALMSKEHPLANNDEIIYSDLSEYIEVVHGDVTVPYVSVNEMSKRDVNEHSKKRIYVYERGSQFDLLTSVDKTYMWVSPIPEEILKRYGLVQRRCKVSNHKYKDALIYSKGYKFTALDKRFIEKLYEAKNEVALKEYR